jgi:hypothetical protein
MTQSGATASEVTALYATWISMAIIIVPATVAILSHIFAADATLSVGAVAHLVGGTILFPLALGVLVAEFAALVAVVAAKVASLAKTAGVLLLLVLIVFHQRGAAAALAGDGTLLVLVLAVTLAGGHLLGHPRVSLAILFLVTSVVSPASTSSHQPEISGGSPTTS